ncbi:hypothetical protein [Actinoplanes sp. N902-109]|uniref:hypothetical protein n=1 Tax=Actinoplanes sp. (strain N902-109) TaxID=649831 RepID=UPI0003293D84|nr:hypothetical protein [Actinoplanes sp. N902-109]AGL13847.1 hypothetical protein L083_0337 [Actinoplanes sp. N902-109]
MVNPRKDIQAKAAELFAVDTAKHELTVLLDQGLYRHLRCANPATGIGWFEIVTWPGSLAVRGDMDAGYVFHRIDDMFEFFRRNGNEQGINPSYWAEKLDHGPQAGTKRYDQDSFRERLDEEIAEYERAYPDIEATNEQARAKYEAVDWREQWPMKSDGPRPPRELLTPSDVRSKVDSFDGNGDLTFEEGARDLLRELETADVISGAWEWDLSGWDYHFLWTCHAIVWAIEQYDAAKAPAAEAVSAR